MDKWLIIVGASIYGLLGGLHLFFTFYSNKFHPRDSAKLEDLKKTKIYISKETSLWKAWVGFNASHSLGALFIPLFYIPLSLFHIELIRSSLWFKTLPIFIGIFYLILAFKYWFKIPFYGVGLATLLFILAFFL